MEIFSLLLSLAPPPPPLSDAPAMPCQVVVDRFKGFAFCQFSRINSKDFDIWKINATTTNFQGQAIETREVTAVSFAWSDVDRLPSSIFNSEVFGNITQLQFYGGHWKTISPESFDGAASLKILEVHNVTISEVVSRAFVGATDLEEILLRDCRIADIAKDAFEGLQNLKQLRLINSKIPNEDFLRNLPSLVKIVKK